MDWGFRLPFSLLYSAAAETILVVYIYLGGAACYHRILQHTHTHKRTQCDPSVGCYYVQSSRADVSCSQQQQPAATAERSQVIFAAAAGHVIATITIGTC